MGTVSIDKNELERIRKLAQIDDIGIINEQREAKSRMLREKSLEKKKNWPNTLEAIRNKKLNNRREKEERRELQQQEVDRQEAEYRKMQRLEAIRKASEMLYEQNDKMKYLRTQQRYVDVIMGRRTQIKEKADAAKRENEDAHNHHMIMMEQVREAREKEWEDLRKKEEQTRFVAKTRTEQFEELKRRRRQEEEEERLLGLAMKKAADTRLLEDLNIREKKALDVRNERIKMLEMNAELNEEKRRIEQAEAEADKERELEILKISDRKKAREDLEKRRFDEAQASRQKIVQKAVDLLAATKNNEDARVLREREEYNNKEREKEERKEAKSKQDWDELVHSRSAMVEKKRVLEQIRKEEEIKLAKSIKVNAEAMLTAEQISLQKARDRSREIKVSLLVDAAERKRFIAEERIKEKEKMKLLLKATEDADDKYKSIVKKAIDEYSTEGKPIVTLLKALRFKQPELVPGILNKSARVKKQDT